MDIQRIEAIKKQNAMLSELNRRLLKENKMLKAERRYLLVQNAMITVGDNNISEELNRVYSTKGWKMLELMRRIRNGLKRRIKKVLRMD